MEPHSEKFLRQRKFFMALPLLVLPFVTLLFWALGGGKGTPAQAKEKEYSGLNLELPGAFFTEEDDNWNKFDLYEKARQDSLKFHRARKNDPYYEITPLLSQNQSMREELKNERNSAGKSHGKLNTSLTAREEEIDPNEAMVNRKLEQLYKKLEGNAPRSLDPVPETELHQGLTESSRIGADVDRLEMMMLMMREGETEDPEMAQIEEVLEKILDIQHPERVEEKLREMEIPNSKQAFPVEKYPERDDISLLAPEIPYQVSQNFQNGFYGLGEEIVQDRKSGNAIEAVVHDTQELMAGSSIKMRLLNDVYVNGKLISKGQFIYGVCNIRGDRMTVDIESIRTENSLVPVSLSVFDLDGLEGIYIPGAIARNVAKQSTDQAMQGMEFFSLDPSVSAQAANAGIQAAKTLLSKKAKAVKVTVKAGYRILLYGTNA